MVSLLLSQAAKVAARVVRVSADEDDGDACSGVSSRFCQRPFQTPKRLSLFEVGNLDLTFAVDVSMLRRCVHATWTYDPAVHGTKKAAVSDHCIRPPLLSSRRSALPRYSSGGG